MWKLKSNASTKGIDKKEKKTKTKTKIEVVPWHMLNIEVCEDSVVFICIYFYQVRKINTGIPTRDTQIFLHYF